MDSAAIKQERPVKDIEVSAPWAGHLFSGRKKAEVRKNNPENWGATKKGDLLRVKEKGTSRQMVFEVVEARPYATLEACYVAEGVRNLLPGLSTVNEADDVYLGFDGADENAQNQRRLEFGYFGCVAIELFPVEWVWGQVPAYLTDSNAAAAGSESVSFREADRWMPPIAYEKVERPPLFLFTKKTYASLPPEVRDGVFSPKKIKEPPAPPASAYMFYMAERRPQLMRDRPLHTSTELTNIIAQEWEYLTLNGFVGKYYEYERLDKERAVREYTEYIEASSAHEGT
jgi:ASC-1-like (ASCH) protein